MVKQKRWTNQCACGHYMPDEYDRCDQCLLAAYGLNLAIYDSLDQRGYVPLHKESDVLRALRKAEKKGL